VTPRAVRHEPDELCYGTPAEAQRPKLPEVVPQSARPGSWREAPARLQDRSVPISKISKIRIPLPSSTGAKVSTATVRTSAPVSGNSAQTLVTQVVRNSRPSRNSRKSPNLGSSGNFGIAMRSLSAAALGAEESPELRDANGANQQRIRSTGGSSDSSGQVKQD